jgi:hypothetical protein
MSTFEYSWEPVQETMYVHGSGAMRTAGMFYELLHVEQTAEGWHGFLLGFVPPSSYEDDFDWGGWAVLDEEQFDLYIEAIMWCEMRDSERTDDHLDA